MTIFEKFDLVTNILLGKGKAKLIFSFGQKIILLVDKCVSITPLPSINFF